ncbi:TPA: hypothetical protein U2L27_001778 [Acinetobacter baumannii]|nr:hypothetical protein [Acinetobacter baumannii]
MKNIFQTHPFFFAFF